MSPVKSRGKLQFSLKNKPKERHPQGEAEDMETVIVTYRVGAPPRPRPGRGRSPASCSCTGAATEGLGTPRVGLGQRGCGYLDETSRAVGGWGGWWRQDLLVFLTELCQTPTSILLLDREESGEEYFGFPHPLITLFPDVKGRQVYSHMHALAPSAG